MAVDIVFNLTGPDRVGIVEDVTKVLLGMGGNAGTSRMARLGGQFAILMQVTLPGGEPADVEAAFADLHAQGYKITATYAGESPLQKDTDWMPYRIEVSGADHEGIIHEFARELAHMGINIESADTGTVPSPISGSPLFMMNARVAVPISLKQSDWVRALEEAADQANVDLHVSVDDAL